MLQEDENMGEFVVDLPNSEKLVCFVCKAEHDDEKAFREHYKQFHGKMSEEDAGKLREMVERSRLQNEAISKEYSLRATASRKAFRSEIEITEQILGVSHGYGEDETAFTVPGKLDSSKLQSVHRQPSITEGISDTREKNKSDGNDGENGTQPTSSADGGDDEPAKKSAFAAALNLQVMS